MTLIKIIKLLQEQGFNISYRKRSDGGYIVKSVNGMKFEGAAGNQFIRAMTGNSLTTARAAQLQSIKPPAGVAPLSRKKRPLTEDLLKGLKRAQYAWRKEAVSADKGRVTRKNIRYIYEKYGEEAAKVSLRKSIQYAKGYAYDENVEALAQRVERLGMAYGSDELIELASHIRAMMGFFKDEWIAIINEIMYDLEKSLQRESDSSIIIQLISDAVNRVVTIIG